MNTQSESLPQPSSILWGDQIHMFSLNTSHRNISNTPKVKFQYLKIIIQSMLTNNSIFNDVTIKKKSPQVISVSNMMNVDCKVL